MGRRDGERVERVHAARGCVQEIERKISTYVVYASPLPIVTPFLHLQVAAGSGRVLHNRSDGRGRGGCEVWVGERGGDRRGVRERARSFEGSEPGCLKRRKLGLMMVRTRGMGRRDGERVERVHTARGCVQKIERKISTYVILADPLVVIAFSLHLQVVTGGGRVLHHENSSRRKRGRSVVWMGTCGGGR